MIGFDFLTLISTRFRPVKSIPSSLSSIQPKYMPEKQPFIIRLTLKSKKCESSKKAFASRRYAYESNQSILKAKLFFWRDFDLLLLKN